MHQRLSLYCAAFLMLATYQINCSENSSKSFVYNVAFNMYAGACNGLMHWGFSSALPSKAAFPVIITIGHGLNQITPAPVIYGLSKCAGWIPNYACSTALCGLNMAVISIPFALLKEWLRPRGPAASPIFQGQQQKFKNQSIGLDCLQAAAIIASMSCFGAPATLCACHAMFPLAVNIAKDYYDSVHTH